MKILGSGTYGVVYRIFNKPGLAFKRSSLSELSWIREISIVKMLNHPNIVKFNNIEINPVTNKIIVEMPHYPQCLYNLDQGIKNPDTIINKLFDALLYCHQHGVIHRDLKEENIMLDIDQNPIILDFGLSHYKSIGALSSSVASLAFIPPEVHNFDKDSKMKLFYDTRLDVWAFGLIVADLVCDEYFYDHIDNNSKELTRKFKKEYPKQWTFHEIKMADPEYDGSECNIYDFLLSNPSLFYIYFHKFLTKHTIIFAKKYSTIIKRCVCPLKKRAYLKDLAYLFPIKSHMQTPAALSEKNAVLDTISDFLIKEFHNHCHNPPAIYHYYKSNKPANISEIKCFVYYIYCVILLIDKTPSVNEYIQYINLKLDLPKKMTKSDLRQMLYDIVQTHFHQK